MFHVYTDTDVHLGVQLPTNPKCVKSKRSVQVRVVNKLQEKLLDDNS